MKIVALIDNKAEEGLACEWGLCVYIEYKGKKYLLDTGSSNKYADNAKAMHILIPEIDVAILSHAHYDHSGGYDDFFSQNKKAKLYIREGSGENCYSLHGFFREYIGVPKGMLNTYSDRITYVSGDYRIDEGVYLIPHKREGMQKKGKKIHMYIKQKHRWKYDDFSHEQSLVFKTKEGLIIFNSCSHGGADNIITEVLDTFPGEKIYAMIGGFHLYKSSKEEVVAFANRLKECNVSCIYTGHCTGDKAFSILQEVLKDKVKYFAAGTVLEIS